MLWCDGLKVKPSSASNRQRRGRESDGDETDEDADETFTRSQKKDKNMHKGKEEKVCTEHTTENMVLILPCNFIK